MSKKKVLVTVNRDLGASLFLNNSLKDIEFIHLPLETYQYKYSSEESEKVIENLETYTFIIHGNLRNARFFLEWAEENKQVQRVRQKINLVQEKPVFDFLESCNIPAVMPKEDAKPIDLLEFILRISREGTALYPTTDQMAEEMPGLFQELEMPLREFSVCTEIPLTEQKLTEYRERLAGNSPDLILYHNRSSVTRIKTAFPAIKQNGCSVVAGSRGAAEKLKHEGVEPDREAFGSWKSIIQCIKELV